MVSTLSQKTAQKLVNTVKDVCGQDINFINTDGIIFASTNRNRIGEFHEIGKKVIDTKEIIEVETDGSFYGTQKGVNIPILYKHEIIAAIGISGTPNNVRQYAILAQKIATLLLREQEIDALNFRNRNQINSVVHSLVENSHINQEFLIEFLEKQKLSVYDSYRTLIIQPNTRYNPSNLAMLESEILQFFTFIPSSMYSINYPNNYWIIISNSDYKKHAKHIRKWATNYEMILNIGIGSKESIHRQHISFSKAEIALSSLSEQSNIACYDDLTLEIITGSLAPNITEEFHKKTIDNLAQADIDLLKIYFEKNLSLKETSETLFIHKNTVQYQLNKIEKITGFDPRKFTEAVILYLAIKLKFI